MRPISARRPVVVSVADIGSSKVCALVARLTPGASDKMLPGRTHDVEVVGFGLQRARGMRSGLVIDLDKAEQSVRLAVDAAERAAGIEVESLIVNLTAGRPKSETLRASVDLVQAEVDEADIRRVLAAGGSHSISDGRALLHSLPVAYGLDGARGIRDPRGMLGRTLSVDMHIVTADTAPLRNLELLVNRCHLQVETVVATGYAAGLSTLVDDEAELGVACVDMGGGTTSLAVFSEGQFVHADTIPLGGDHITMDIARGLSTQVAEAERLKTLHGSALATGSDDLDVVAIKPVGEESGETVTVPKSALTRIVKPRIDEILELTRDRLNASGFSARIGRRVVLTGGASQLTGLVEAARRVLGRNVRLGRPLGFSGLPAAAKGPAFAAAAGLLVYPQVARIEQFDVRGRRLRLTGTDGYLGRFGQWLRESW